jgi:hypothetical protein
MNLREAGSRLDQFLRSKYTNIQAVGLHGSNSEAYKKNPEMFAYENKEDSLIVYTTTKPSRKQLELTLYEGFKVTWKKIGKLVM